MRRSMRRSIGVIPVMGAHCLAWASLAVATAPAGTVTEHTIPTADPRLGHR